MMNLFQKEISVIVSMLILGFCFSFAQAQDDTGSLKVIIKPAAAVEQGAKWRRLNTEIWYESDEEEEDVPKGSYSIEFLQLEGWYETPLYKDVSVSKGRLKKITVTLSPKPIPGPGFAGCRELNYGSTPYASLPIFNPTIVGAPVTSWPEGSYEFCGIMDTVYCSLKPTVSLVDPRVNDFAGLIQCFNGDINGPLDTTKEVPIGPNGILDGSYELAIAAAVLNDPHHALYASAKAAFQHNVNATKDLIIEAMENVPGYGNLLDILRLPAPHLIPGLATLLSGYAVLGDAQTDDALDELFVLLEGFGVQLIESAFSTLTENEPELGMEGDANRDGITNRQVYTWYVEKLGYSPEDFVHAAITPGISPPEPEIYLGGGGLYSNHSIITLEVEVESGTPIAYTWYKDDVLIAETTEGILSIEDASAEDEGEYSVEVLLHPGYDDFQTIIMIASDRVDVDTNGPTIISYPIEYLIDLSEACKVLVPDLTGEVEAMDDRSPADKLIVSQEPLPGTIFAPDENIFILLSVSDEAGNTSQCTVDTVVQDITAPIITLLGEESLRVECGSEYSDAGATARDACDGDSEVTVVNSVVTSILGSYTVSYTVSDSSGNEAIETRVVIVEDTTAPIITLLGEETVTVECGAGYSDAGATAFDVCDGDLEVTVDNSVDTSVPGSYTVSFTVSDSSGNEAIETRAVIVEDTTSPIITLLGEESLTVECGSEYSDAGATALDICDGDLEVTVDNSVDISVSGTYRVRYSASDSAGNEAIEVMRTVIVEDTTAPVITLLGEESLTVECGSEYSDAGATALDACDGDLEVTVDNFVVTSVLGSYTVSYAVSDAAGNEAIEVMRTVIVEDTTAPLIALLGEETVTVECGADYSDAGATALDACDGDLEVTVDNSVDTSVPGSYTVSYTVSDSSGNEAIEMRVVIIEDTTSPIITLLGEESLTVECGADYSDAGATAFDVCDGDLEVTVDNSVDTSVPGNYTVSYTVSDSSGNEAIETRVVIVEDTTAPIITLLGEESLIVECGTDYSDAGATALDICDGDLEVTVDNSVDTSVPGSYTVSYTVSDSSGNVADEMMRTVIVEDTTAPIITLLGEESLTVECGADYSDAGATALDICDGDLEVTIDNSVDSSVPGSYTVSYTVSDSSGNVADEVIRTVMVNICPEGEGEGEESAEGEGEDVVEGEGEELVEGEEPTEGEDPVEGEGEEVVEGEDPVEGEAPVEGEEVVEGEDPVEGEAQPEGEEETEDDAGCCRNDTESKTITNNLRKYFADWLLIGVSMSVLLMMSSMKRRA
ncbi:MAG: immunoglobulin-like domain-containing protein [Candidatus Hydrogenedentales bacterium]